MVGCCCALGPVARQHVMTKVCGKWSCSLHGGQETKIKEEEGQEY
jgi:hypothetical protein